MLEYTIGIMRDGGRPRRYIRIKSDEAIQVLDPVVSFTRAQEDKRSVYECIIGALIHEAQEGGFFYEWYELESVLVEVDHTLPVAATVQRMGPEATIAAAKIARLTLPGLDLDDGQRIAVSALYEDWSPGAAYKVGDVRNAGGQTWECFQEHDSAVYPDISPEGTAWRTFWRPLHGNTPETARPFVEVQGAHDTYKAGEYMVWIDGTVRECIRETSFGPDDDPDAWSLPDRPAPAAAEAADLEAMTIPQLKEYAKEHGISLAGKTLKADIVAAIKAEL